MPSGVTDAGFCLVTVLTPRATWDVALPVDVPVAELVPMVMELVGEPVFGIRPQPWRLSGMGGGPLPPERSLRELGVLDGELLRLAPAGPPPPAPVFDDPVDAVAATTSAAPRDERRFRAVAALLLTLAAALVLAAGPLALLSRLTAPPLVIDAVTPSSPDLYDIRDQKLAGPDPAPLGAPLGHEAAGVSGNPDSARPAIAVAATSPVPPAAAVGAGAGAVALLLAGWLARRAVPAGSHPARGGTPDTAPGTGASDPADGVDPPASAARATDDIDTSATGEQASVHTPVAAVAAAAGAVPLAAVAAASTQPGVSGPVRLLLVAAAAGGAAALGMIVMRTLVPALAAVAVAAVPIGLGALAVRYGHVAPTAAATAVAAGALVSGPVLPRVALWMSGLPRPVVPADAGELAGADDDRGPPPGELPERAGLARRLLAGLIGGAAVPAAAGAPAALAAGGWSGPAFAAVTIALLALRARSFADAAPSRALASAALAATAGSALVLAATDTGWARLGAPIGLLLGALLLLITLDRGPTPGSPVRRRLVDLGEGVLTAAVLPLALAATDAYAMIRAW
jgi:hypothetical protein